LKIFLAGVRHCAAAFAAPRAAHTPDGCRALRRTLEAIPLLAGVVAFGPAMPAPRSATGESGTTRFDTVAEHGPKRQTFATPENGIGPPSAQTEAAFGGFGSILKLAQSRPGADTGVLTLLFLGDVEHTGLDNCAFWSADRIVFVENAGDKLHTQRNAFDSAWVFDVRANYAKASTPPPVRLLALGRDASATLDSGYSAAGNGFQNEGDNEITGFHVSDGDPTVRGILGARIPLPFLGWRVFYTQQHGDNATWELFPLLPGAFASDGD
jgi:hypothetical protein